MKVTHSLAMLHFALILPLGKWGCIVVGPHDYFDKSENLFRLQKKYTKGY